MEVNRADERTTNQLRPLACSRNVLNRAHDSPRDTKVLAAVYGPKAGTKKNENPEKACIDVIWKTKSGKNVKEYEMILKRTLQSICVLNVYPNTTTSIIVQVVHDDGRMGNVLEIAEHIDIAIDVAHAVTYLHTYTGKEQGLAQFPQRYQVVKHTDNK
ncbi:unnamed protein product [Rhodiola kirilowii]